MCDEPKVTPEIQITPTKINVANGIKTTEIIAEQVISKQIKHEVDSNPPSTQNEIQVAQKEEIEELQMPIINQEPEQEIVVRKSNYVNVDELLASVDNASQKKNPMGAKSNIKVNANNLLSQVDGELDLTFREKAINIVNQKYKTAKLALSNRNSE